MEEPQAEQKNYQNRMVLCVDCPDKKEFIWEAGEQAFYERNRLHPPIRCPYHRKLKAQRRSQEAQKGTYDRSEKGRVE